MKQHENPQNFYSYLHNVCSYVRVAIQYRNVLDSRLLPFSYNNKKIMAVFLPLLVHSFHSIPFYSIFQIIHADAVIIDGFHVSEVYNFCIIYLVLHNLMGTYIQFFFFCLSRHHIGYLKFLLCTSFEISDILVLIY